MTPMQEQYNRIKSKYSDAVVLFRLGDFYETFDQDAELVSKVLGITLTGRGKDENRRPMAGIPYHALQNYLPKLIDAGLKVAIADQMEEPTPGKIVERKVTKVITPGTVYDENTLDSSKNNLIAVAYSEEKAKDNYGLVFADLSTGLFIGFSSNQINEITNEIKKYSPSEIIASDNLKDKLGDLNKSIQFFDTSLFKEDSLKDHFKVKSLKGFGIDEDNQLKKTLTKAGGGLINYLRKCEIENLGHINKIKLYSYSKVMQLDFETIRNLELIFPMNNDRKSPTLYSILNKCKTTMGQRKLRNWILAPLLDQNALEERLNIVDEFFNDPFLSSGAIEIIKGIYDLERISGRISLGSANPRDILALKYSLESVQNLKKHLSQNNTKPIQESLNKISFEKDDDFISKIIAHIENSIDDNAPVSINQGGVIREGYSEKIDELRYLRSNSKEMLAQIQKREVERTGISSLKVSFNNVFGYYIEITRANISKVPEDYIRKQTLANAERYITEELKSLEAKILSAESELLQIENRLFNEIRSELSKFSPRVIELGDLVAEIDILINFSEIARENRYVRPKIITRNEIRIVNGRHPVVEKLVPEFTNNSSELGEKKNINIITGPNMSGKSTYIRQVALLSLMAQIGSYVPADEMEFSILDRIFTRVGAGDNLSKGESTFMVEMHETANILNNATNRSLVILDEVGRGTSTYDGVAIAWSIVEYIANKIKAKTLFATHYFELTALEDKLESVENYCVKVIEDNDSEILFTHKIERGTANRSYGVYVAKIAGVPSDVVERADQILSEFERSNGASNSSKKDNSKKSSSGPVTAKKIHPEQLGLM